MSIWRLEKAKFLKSYGRKIGRDGMSVAVIDAVYEFDGSYKGAMILAGRLKAITQMASCDDYWSEQVSHGFMKQLRLAEIVNDTTPMA